MKNEDIKLILDMQFTATRAMLQAMEEGVNRRFDVVDQCDKRRNGRIDKLEKDTEFWRWVQRNSGFSIPAAIVLLVALIWGIGKLGPEKVIERATGVNIEAEK